MTRRSLNTYMNAWTCMYSFSVIYPPLLNFIFFLFLFILFFPASDHTSYPFATQNEKDYFNLLSVYLDAVFYPKLDEIDFRQEGHRLEFEGNKGKRGE
jgi:Zn-dependent M16 (insulinase) family peptidase